MSPQWFNRASTKDLLVRSEVSTARRDGEAHGPQDFERLRELIRDVLRGALLADARLSERECRVRVLLRKACEVARAHDIHAEQLIILLKESWHEIPKPRRGNHNDVQSTLDGVVSLCIEEYYGPAQTS